MSLIASPLLCMLDEGTGYRLACPSQIWVRNGYHIMAPVQVVQEAHAILRHLPGLLVLPTSTLLHSNAARTALGRHESIPVNFRMQLAGHGYQMVGKQAASFMVLIMQRTKGA